MVVPSHPRVDGEENLRVLFCAAKEAVVQGDDALAGILVADGTGSVTATVIDEDEFPIRVGLGQHVLNALPDVGLRIVDRDNDRNH